jgi:hypothetical protein
VLAIRPFTQHRPVVDRDREVSVEASGHRSTELQ